MIASALGRILPCTYDVVVSYPGWAPVVRHLRPRHTVYDRLDDYRLFPGHRSTLIEEEGALMSTADLILATHPRLLPETGPTPAILVPNAAARQPLPEIQAHRRERRIIYVGAIEEWFDWTAVAKLAQELSGFVIEVVGSGENQTPKEGLPPNVVLTGELAYERAMDRMRQSSVGIIPFHVTEFTKTIDPVKAYEYLAAGLPVVATPFLDRSLIVAGGVHLCEDGAAMAREVRRLHDGLDAKERLSLAEKAQLNSWDARAETLHRALQAL